MLQAHGCFCFLAVGMGHKGSIEENVCKVCVCVHCVVCVIHMQVPREARIGHWILWRHLKWVLGTKLGSLKSSKYS